MVIKNERTGFRFGLTTALMFIAGMILGWESAYLAAVYLTILLESGKRIPVKGGITLLITTFIIFLAVYAVFTLLLQYPLFFFIALIGGLAGVFAMSVAGKSNLLVTLSLFAVIIIPYTTASSTETAWTLAIWMPLNLGIALVASWVAFIFFPEEKVEPPALEVTTISPSEKKRMFVQLFLSVVPIVAFFQLINGDHLLSILYFSLFSLQLIDPRSSSISPLEKLAANLFAVLAALVAYEIIVIAPTLPMLSLVSILVCLVYGWWLVSGYNNAMLARSGLTGAIILLGDSIAPLADTVEVASVVRLAEISGAVILVTLIFLAVRKLVRGSKTLDTGDACCREYNA